MRVGDGFVVDPTVPAAPVHRLGYGESVVCWEQVCGHLQVYGILLLWGASCAADADVAAIGLLMSVAYGLPGCIACMRDQIFFPQRRGPKAVVGSPSTVWWKCCAPLPGPQEAPEGGARCV